MPHDFGKGLNSDVRETDLESCGRRDINMGWTVGINFGIAMPFQPTLFDSCIQLPRAVFTHANCTWPLRVYSQSPKGLDNQILHTIIGIGGINISSIWLYPALNPAGLLDC